MSEATTVEAQPEGETIAAPVWKNLIFLRNGRSVLGFHEFPTEAAAARAVVAEQELRRLMRININMRVVRRTDRSHLYYCREYSHAIQVPWKPAA